MLSGHFFDLFGFEERENFEEANRIFVGDVHKILIHRVGRSEIGIQEERAFFRFAKLFAVAAKDQTGG